jgi:hypothetical protein
MNKILRQTRRRTSGTADEVRVGDQSQDGKANRPNDSAGGARPGDYADQVSDIGFAILDCRFFYGGS